MRRADHVRRRTEALGGGIRLGKSLFFPPDWEPRSESAHGVRFLFTGREWLAPLGLYDYRHRADSPTLDRFLQVDPLGVEGGGLNPHGYMRNVPVLLGDPKGDVPLALVGALMGGGSAAFTHWNAWRSGRIDGRTFAKAVVMGAAVGAVRGLPLGRVAAAALTAGAIATAETFRKVEVDSRPRLTSDDVRDIAWQTTARTAWSIGGSAFVGIGRDVRWVDGSMIGPGTWLPPRLRDASRVGWTLGTAFSEVMSLFMDRSRCLDR